MRITAIELNNWRAYHNTTFKFDVDDPAKNCVLIGAPNGYGKTSLFEAITLCIYGKKGLPLLARAADKNRVDTPYDKFLSNILHKAALSSAAKRLSVKISFLADDNTKVRVERNWYFNPSGLHKASDEQFTIWVNDKVETLDHGQDRSEWEAEQINRFFVPHSLAQFFLFDGEMVRDLARMDQATQVKKGIEGLMGVPILRNLIDSLDNYSVRKRSGVRNTKTDTNPAELGKKIEELEDKIQELKVQEEEYEKSISTLTLEQKDLFKEFSSFGSTETTQKVELHQRLNEATVQRDEIYKSLQEKLVTDFSMGLVGREILASAINLLDSDQTLEDWEASKNQGEKGYENFINTVQIRLREEVKIPEKHHAAVVGLIESTWGSIWHPRPSNCPDERAFGELHGGIRNKVKERFASLITEAGSGLQSGFNKFDALEGIINGLNADIRNADAIGPRQEEISKRLTQINDELAQHNSGKGAVESQKTGYISEKNAMKASLEQITNLQKDAAPILEAAKRSDHLASVVSKIINAIIPLQSDDLAARMSEIYRTLSNKTLVKRVAIDNDFHVQLVGSEGQNIRETEMSAGEEQIFSQALISSVVQVSNFDFPMIIDTPLARLDGAHRTAILEHFKKSNRQIIFLSTDTEIIGKYFDLVEDNLSNTFILKNTTRDGVGYTNVEEGYFQ